VVEDDAPNDFTVRSLPAGERPAGVPEGAAGVRDRAADAEDASYWLDRAPDVFLTSVSPPDAEGWCSFG
jgi:hypothetical protein